MDKNQKPVEQLAPESLVVITSLVIFVSLAIHGFQEDLHFRFRKIVRKLTDQVLGILLSLAYAILLPLVSYLFSHVKKTDGARAGVFIAWTVLVESLRVLGRQSEWKLQAAAEQLAHLVWLAFLIYNHEHSDELRAILWDSHWHTPIGGIHVYRLRWPKC